MTLLNSPPKPPVWGWGMTSAPPGGAFQVTSGGGYTTRTWHIISLNTPTWLLVLHILTWHIIPTIELDLQILRGTLFFKKGLFLGTNYAE